jgi:predicted ATPase
MRARTYRTDEPSRGLSHFLAELDRGRRATELMLRRLSLPDVDAMLRAVFDLNRPVGADFLQTVFELTEGNPFFIEEVLKSLHPADDAVFTSGVRTPNLVDARRVPRTVKDAVHRRAARLTQAARRTLDIAAVVGRRFDFALLQRLTGHSEHKLVMLLKELQ